MRMAHALGIAMLAIFFLFVLAPTSQAAPPNDGALSASLSWILSGGGALDATPTSLWSSLGDDEDHNDDHDGDRHDDEDGDCDDDGQDSDHDGDHDGDRHDDEDGGDDDWGSEVATETVNWSTLKGAY